MKSRSTGSESVDALRASLERLTTDASQAVMSGHKRKKLEAQIKSAIDDLTTLLATLDPIAQPTSIFDPSNPKVVGRFVALALVAQDRHPLSEIPKFYGSGVYAIYYKGKFPAYQPISGTETPIYVGQAAPTMSNARTPLDQGARLCGRLTDHRKNIGKAAASLDLADFEFRSLVVQSGWETAAEDYLIHLFRPIWNSETNILYGLGKHGDSATTRANRRSPWDTLHPGRAWAADSTEDAKSVDQINTELGRHFANLPAYYGLESVLTSFIEELRQG
jgi:Eco29kI restriction endonuclease